MPLFWKLTEGGGVEPSSDNRHVGLLVVRSVAGEGRVVISTIFLGIDHAFGSGTPILFETGVIVRGKTAEVLTRYRTFLEALDGHTRYVGELFGVMPHETSYGPIRALARRVSSDISPVPSKERH